MKGTQKHLWAPARLFQKPQGAPWLLHSLEGFYLDSWHPRNLTQPWQGLLRGGLGDTGSSLEAIDMPTDMPAQWSVHPHPSLSLPGSRTITCSSGAGSYGASLSAGG